ncbi:substrate-specific activator of APC-dependent proteolysis [Borealophlyctis nickersoniae]|nr:substrate-specific activator of APC-dependent proteolysis [Borealophlyctis nickersoniae]
MAWANQTELTSGSRDRTIIHRDARARPPVSKITQGHTQEVCGLKWDPKGKMLASGGNDNKLLIWDKRRIDFTDTTPATPMFTFQKHEAAVKALAWSPHQDGLLASGGGTADKHIRFWDLKSRTQEKYIGGQDTGSQVCNLSWSPHSPADLVSTHGYSTHDVRVWRYDENSVRNNPLGNGLGEPVVSLKGHTLRVLYLATSPCGENIVTGAGDETLRFWKVFKKTRSSRSMPRFELR